METLITIIHVIVSLFLIFVVLLQQGKGAGMGAVFGGAGQAVFGPRSEGNIMGKITAVTAVLFMLTSMSLVRFATSGESMVKQRIEQTQAAGSTPTDSSALEAEAAPAPEGEAAPAPEGEAAPAPEAEAAPAAAPEAIPAEAAVENNAPAEPVGDGDEGTPE